MFKFNYVINGLGYEKNGRNFIDLFSMNKKLVSFIFPWNLLNGLRSLYLRIDVEAWWSRSINARYSEIHIIFQRVGFGMQIYACVNDNNYCNAKRERERERERGQREREYTRAEGASSGCWTRRYIRSIGFLMLRCPTSESLKRYHACAN